MCSLHYKQLLTLHNLIFKPLNLDFLPGGNGMENDPGEIIIHISKIPDDVYIPLLRNLDVINTFSERSMRNKFSVVCIHLNYP